MSKRKLQHIVTSRRLTDKVRFVRQ